MRLLLDTCTFLWLAENDARLSAHCQALFQDSGNSVAVSAALVAGCLPMLHRDPFDRLLVGQAIRQGLTILTPDPLIRQYAVPVMW